MMLAEEVLELLRHPTGLLTSCAGPSCCVSPHMYLRYELLFVINHLSADFCRLRQRVVRAAAAASVLPGGAGVTSVPLPLPPLVSLSLSDTPPLSLPSPPTINQYPVVP